MNDTCIWKSVIAFASLIAALGSAALPDKAFAAPAGREIVIVAFGDSLTAGYLLPPEAAFPVQLERALRAKGHNVRVVNAGVSGDTATEGLARFDWAMPDKADAAILELGANDAMRGTPVAETTKALGQILARLKERNADVLIAGMEAPRNWGEEYVTQFRAMYAGLAKQYDVPLYPFFLDGVAMDPSLSLSDGLHPNQQGVARIVERILPAAEALIAKVKARRGEPS
ncbi:MULTISPECIES: arylesterase [Rhodomicrobium]|uniref:arylesterase n=1 Tax=Rhodomicrobium TaxID=1068 RepID=UPI000B4B16A2|nr:MULTISPECIES: arylesterase [Rhodomicrobium]